jgi:hypothetical protein
MRALVIVIVPLRIMRQQRERHGTPRRAYVYARMLIVVIDSQLTTAPPAFVESVLVSGRHPLP